MLIAAAHLEALVRDIFTHEGCADDEARRIGRYLVAANLTGHDSHGVIRVPRYISWLREGTLVAGAIPEVVSDAGAFALLDAHHGFGQTAGPVAVQLGIAKAAEHGVAVVALRHSGHLGRIGEWAEQAAEAGLVSIHFVNVAGSLLVAPFGAVDRRFSTAPFAAGLPVPGQPPVVLDFRHVDRGRRQGPGGVEGRQTPARGKPDRTRRPAEPRSRHALRPARRDGGPRPRQGAWGDPRLRRP